MDSLTSRTWIAAIGFFGALYLLAPNVFHFEKKWYLPQTKINYGLDIQGGVHLVMGVDVEGVVAESANRLASSLRAELAKENIAVTEVKTTKAREGELEFVFSGGETKGKLEAYLSKAYGSVLQVMNSSESGLQARYFDAYMADYKGKVIQQAIETIRNRVDEFGVAEPSITQQGNDRILVQLPGMADAEKAKQLINTTAKLDFMIVETSVPQADLQKLIADAEKAGSYSITTMKYSEYANRINEDLRGKIPEKTVVYFQKSDNAKTMETGAMPYLLKADTGLGGDSLDSAGVGFGQYGEPEVTLRFNSAGAAKFADITGNNVNRQMAVVLDKVIKTAPSIRNRIPDGSAVITLGNSRDRDGMMNEAKMISTALRAGALPASLEQLEERRVGPSLGSDAVNKAKMGSYMGALLIVLFMLVYYRGMGVVSVLALALNILTIFALLSSLGATLTLPGIAGIALTVGFAVDANVLINERIREELKKGASLKGAIQEGYNRAFSAIIDANLTTAATAVVLLYFGTGPVRGFAVTLLMGIVATMFANVFLSKVLVDNLVYRFNMKKISV